MTRCNSHRVASSVSAGAARSSIGASSDAEISGAIGGQRPSDGVVVAQPAMAVFQIGLEQRRDITGLRPTLGRDRAQFGEPARSFLPPLVDTAGDQVGNVSLAAGEVAHAQDRRRRDEVGRRQREQRLDGMCRRAELHAGVPHRIPQRLGDGPNLFGAGALRVDQDDIDVASGAQQTVGVATGCDDRPAWRQTTRASASNQPSIWSDKRRAKPLPERSSRAISSARARRMNAPSIDFATTRPSMSAGAGEVARSTQ